jgi:hypothetical protein
VRRWSVKGVVVLLSAYLARIEVVNKMGRNDTPLTYWKNDYLPYHDGDIFSVEFRGYGEIHYDPDYGWCLCRRGTGLRIPLNQIGLYKEHPIETFGGYPPNENGERSYPILYDEDGRPYIPAVDSDNKSYVDDTAWWKYFKAKEQKDES